MPLTVIQADAPDKWDALVRSFREYDVYHLSGYVKGLQLHGDGTPLLIYYEDENIRGMNVVMKRDISRTEAFAGKLEENQWFDFITPYGYGGWLTEGGTDTRRLFAVYGEWCRNNRIVSEFVRFHPVADNMDACTQGYTVIPLGHTIAMDLSSPEVIWENLTSKNRNMIRKAQKSGIRIFNGRFPEIYSKFREIYEHTMDADQADGYYYFGSEYYQSLLNDLSREAQVFWAELDGQVIAASIMLASNGKMHYHLSGSLHPYRNLAPSNLLLYQAALWGSANGCATLHLGGGLGSREDSLYKFKSGFNRRSEVRFGIGKKVYMQEAYDTLVEMAGSPDTGFFPAYRAKL